MTEEFDLGPCPAEEDAVRFDPDDRVAADYALKVEGKGPTTWEEAGVPDPLLSKGRGL